MAKKGKFLYDEVGFLLKEELREPKTYASILQTGWNLISLPPIPENTSISS